MVTTKIDAAEMLVRIPKIEEPTDAERAILKGLCSPRDLLDAKVSESTPNSREFIVRCRMHFDYRDHSRTEYSTHHAVIWSNTNDGLPAMAWGNYMLDAVSSFADFIRR